MNRPRWLLALAALGATARPISLGSVQLDEVLAQLEKETTGAPEAEPLRNLRGFSWEPPKEPEHRSSKPGANFGHIETKRLAGEGIFGSQTALEDLVKDVVNRDYHDVPPVPADGGPLAVGVRVSIVKFRDLDEVTGTMKVTMDLLLCWADDRISFQSEKFFKKAWSHGGDKLTLRSGSIWTPDIVVLNSVTAGHSFFSTEDWPIIICEDAFKAVTGVNVIWSRRFTVETRCDIDMRNFPFDVQTCPIVIGPWASSKRQMILIPQETYTGAGFEDLVTDERDQSDVSIAENMRTSEFLIQNVTRIRTNRGETSINFFEELRYELKLRRYPHFYVINFILPLIAVTLLTMATMWMKEPSVRMNSGTKLLLCIVQIGNITSHWRPAMSGDVWMDILQTHCMAIGMSAVLQSLIMDYLKQRGWVAGDTRDFSLVRSVPTSFDQVDGLLRTTICLCFVVTIMQDFMLVRGAHDARTLYSTFEASSTRFIVAFVFIVAAILGTTTLLAFVMMVLPVSFKEMMLERLGSTLAPVNRGFERLSSVMGSPRLSWRGGSIAEMEGLGSDDERLRDI